MAYMYTALKIISIHDRQVIEINSCLEEIDIPECLTKGKDHPDTKWPQKWTAPNNYRLTSDDVENTNGTNQGH